MLSPRRCREFSDECIGRARVARFEPERDIFLQMAKIWFGAALSLEKSLERIDEHYAKLDDRKTICPKVPEARDGQGGAGDCPQAINHALSVAIAIATGRTSKDRDEIEQLSSSETENYNEKKRVVGT